MQTQESRKISMHSLGHTRSANRRDHLLLTPDTFVRTSLPEIRGGAAIIHISPAAGAAFTQFTVELDADGTLGAPSSGSATQRLVYILNGTVVLTVGGGAHTLAQGGYAYIPAGLHHMIAAQTAARMAVFEKIYKPAEEVAPPQLLVGTEATLASAPLLGDPDLQVRLLLPEDEAFDFAVNTMTYQPGAALSMVEMHVMEHGLLMLEGGGVYRLGDDWYQVGAGDVIWMAPFCPQWFGALGKQPAKYLIYKDCNRHPLG